MSVSTEKLTELRDRAERVVRATEEEEVEAGFRSACLEVIFYLLFVALFAVVTWMSAINVAYPYSSKMREAVYGDPPESFEDVFQESQFWDYLEEQAIPTLFVREDANGDVLPPDQRGYVLRVNKLIGAVRLEQKRVELDPGRCTVPPVYASLIDNCYPSIRTEFDVSDESYGREDRFSAVSTGFFVDVGGQRFVQDFANDAHPDDVVDELRKLRNDSWVDLQTREVHLLFTVYNPAVDLFCNVDLEFKFLHTGGVRPESRFRTVNMLRQWLLLTPSRVFFPPGVEHQLLFIAEMVFFLIVLGMVVAEVRQLARVGWLAYISSVWNVIDVLNLSLFIVFFFYRFFFVALTSLINFRPSPDTYSEFRYMAELTYQSQNLAAFNCVLTYVKLFKYLQFSTRLSQLTHTLTEASEDLAGFLFMFLLVFMAYAFSFHMAFGMDVAKFSDFTNSYFTLFLIILGEFDFVELRLANDLLGPVLFISYIVIVFLILFNMFLAIIGDAYVRVKERTGAYEDPFMRNIRAGFSARKRKRLRKLEMSIDNAGADDVITADEIREIEADLRDILGDEETDVIMAKVSDDDGVFSPDEAAQLMARIVESRQKLEREMRRDERADKTHSLPEEIEAKDPAFALRMSTAKAVRERVEQIEINQKALFTSIQSSQKAIMLKIGSLTDTMDTIAQRLQAVPGMQRR
eukprot:CAMPEP_0206063102 /NCGR_PEP_ID=MMETSP1466-20131121/58059_1 /ASSEMBLY_ACC=CAM_ASM_001126 /TAXON_ID=44452 /ORGANISM="Pavlova gyrans, Strain CCMP608" /LENGTH=689 /DNA_ID=CAMNT_0053438471 /DNA_START=131 /DNA_END=2200 /DNA_ORIENTATION=+